MLKPFTVDHSTEPAFYMNIGSVERAYTDLFVHHNIEIGVALEGSGCLQYNGKSYRIQTGDAYFLDCMTPHRHDSDPGHTLKNLFVHIKYGSLQSLAPQDALVRFLSPFVLLQQGRISPVIKKAAGIFAPLQKAFTVYNDDKQFGYLLAWAHCIEAFVGIIRQVEPAGVEKPNSDMLQSREAVGAGLAYIGAHFAEPITLVQIASECCLSVSRFSAVFTAAMHIAPVAYRNKLRINRALELLTTTSMSIEKIASDCGFNSLVQFRTLFRRTVGKNPLQIRKQ